MIRYLFLLPFFFISSYINAQSTESLLLLADSLLASKDYEPALADYKQALEQAQSAKDHALMAESAIGASKIYARQRDFSNGKILVSSLIPVLKGPLQSTTTLGRIYNYLGYFQVQTNQIGEAIKSYELALAQFQAIDPHSDSAIYTLKEIAQLCTRNLEYERSLSYARKAKENDRSGRYLFNIYNSFFLNYYYMENFEEASIYYQKAFKEVKRDKDRKQLNNTVFLLFLKMNQLGKAETILEELRADNEHPVTILEYEARLALANGNLDLTKQKFKEAIDSLEKDLGQKHRNNARQLCEIADYFRDIGELDYALSLYHKAIIQAYPDFNNTDILSLPTLDQVQTESWMMTAPQKKAETFYQRYLSKENLEDLKQAARCYELGQTAAEEIRRSYRSDAAKVHLGEYGYPSVEEAIHINALLFQETGEQSYLENIYNWMERSRAAVLAESIKRSRNAQLLTIPDSMIVAERELRQALLAVQLQEDQNIRLLDSLQNAYTLLNRNLQVKFPDWENYLSSFKPLPLNELQNSLAKSKTTALIFFWGQKEISVLQVNSKSILWKSLGRPEGIEQEINTYLEFFKSRNLISNDPQKYAQLSFSLYQKLNLAELLNPTKKALIIPDGLLSFLPFETLLSGEASGNDPGSWPFLIKSKDIRIGVSASTAFQTFLVPEKPGKILAFAPMFSDNARGLSTLDYSEEEVRVWQQGKLNTQVGVGTLCNWRNFLDMAQKARIIHLATHARIDSISLEPEIELADTTLGLAELYQLEYPNSLIILSACESGLGRYQRGEGVMNLNRAFTYNGAAALISGLWTVNDAATAQLMASFSKGIERGLSASLALREAKLEWLNNAALSPDRKSPYFWAALTYNGPEFQYLPKKNWSIWYFLLPSGLLVLFISWRLLRSKS